eukprot:6858692-Pyramimonas_sp.AAC.2
MQTLEVSSARRACIRPTTSYRSWVGVTVRRRTRTTGSCATRGVNTGVRASSSPRLLLFPAQVALYINVQGTQVCDTC